MLQRNIIGLYALAFAILALGDLGSTLLGHRVGAREFNPAMAAGVRIDVARFLVVNSVAGVLLTAMFGWALARSSQAERSYLARPWRAALSWITYINPFSARNQARAVFHWAAMAISLLLVRAVVVLNNLAIASRQPDLLTPLVRAVGSYVTDSLLYVVSATILITPFWLVSLYATRLLLLRQARHTTSGERKLREKAA